MVLTQRLSDAWRKHSALGFHTTMVLTQRKSIKYSGYQHYPFPYHYGSHATESSRTRGRQEKGVSIPLWFSRNSVIIICKSTPKRCFHTTMVLTQQVMGSYPSLSTVSVSIPLWFLRNWYDKTWRTNCASFHTTMVLTQLRAEIAKRKADLRFHTTMVLTQRL